MKTFPDQDWYLVQYKPNSYKLAERNLSRQGFATFLPMRKETVRRGAQFVTRAKPLFAGYMFVRVDPNSGQWRKINSTLGVLRIVAFSDQPCPVPSGLVYALKAKSASDEKLSFGASYEQGDKVLVISGPFSEFIAQIDQIDDQQRIWILLDLMGQKTRVQIEAEQVIATEL